MKRLQPHKNANRWIQIRRTCKKVNAEVVRAFVFLPPVFTNCLYWCYIVFMEKKVDWQLLAWSFFHFIQLKWIWGFYSSGRKKRKNNIYFATVVGGCSWGRFVWLPITGNSCLIVIHFINVSSRVLPVHLYLV
jgi:hypothetical protein